MKIPTKPTGASISLFVCGALTLALFAVLEAYGKQHGSPHIFSTAVPQVNSEFEQQIIAMERSSWDLAVKRDTEGYKALHATNFFTVSGQGVADRFRSEASALDPGVRFDRYDLSRYAVTRVGPDSVFVTYSVQASGSDHGRPFVMDSYATSLWMKQNGRWLNVFYQATPATPR
jgi:hypothetical protein